MIRPEDDYFHPGGDDPYWNESSAHMFHVPERNLSGLIYMWHRPNMKCTGAQVSIWDDQFSERADMAFYEYTEYNPLPESANMFDFELDCGLSCKLLEPLNSYQWDYRGDGCELDLVFDAVTPVYERLNSSGDEGTMSEEFKGFADRDANATAGHYSQGARARGTITLEGETIEVDSCSFRDHSWGPRKPVGRFQRGAWTVCVTEDSAFDVWFISELPGDTDPLIGTTEKAVMGMLFRDGVLSPIVGGEHRTLERDGRGMPLRGEITATDKLGRTLEAVGGCHNWHRWNGHGNVTDVVSLADWEYDGTKAFGIHEEFRTLRQSRRLARSLQAAQV